jgi:hypothetical protein
MLNFGFFRDSPGQLVSEIDSAQVDFVQALSPEDIVKFLGSG